MNALVRYLHPVDKNLQRIKKTDKNFARKLDSRDMNFPVKIKHICTIEKKISVCVFGYGSRQIFPVYVSKNTLKGMSIYY